MQKNKQKLKKIWDIIKAINIHMMRTPEADEKKGYKNYLKK